MSKNVKFKDVLIGHHFKMSGTGNIGIKTHDNSDERPESVIMYVGDNIDVLVDFENDEIGRTDKFTDDDLGW